jgi:glutathione S-transferase
MILIGQYDSPFVRRVGIAMALYGMKFEHKPWSTFSDVDKLRPYNPLTRVPTLVIDTGEVLIESHMIIDYLDGIVGPERAMFPGQEPLRHQMLKVAALATGCADKAVSLFYEKRLHERASQVWEERCRNQITGALRLLETDRASRRTPYWVGEAIGHADIAVACALRLISDAHPGMIAMADMPALAAHASRLEALPVFQEIAQPFIAPA